MSTDYRALCAELIDALDSGIPTERMVQSPLITRARAALAQPEPEVPTDEEIMELMPQQMHEDLAASARAMAGQAGTDNRNVTGMMRIILNRHAVDLARAALAQPEPVGPTDEELLGVMLKAADSVPGGQCTGILDWDQEAVAAARAVLARWGRPAITPISVSERLPEATDCDEEGRCWLGYESKTVDAVIFGETLKEFGPTYPAEWVFDKLPDNLEELVGAPVAWLPAHALPLPAMASCG